MAETYWRFIQKLGTDKKNIKRLVCAGGVNWKNTPPEIPADENLFNIFFLFHTIVCVLSPVCKHNRCLPHLN